MITITILKNPFNYNDKEVHSCEYIPGKTAYEYIQPYIMGLEDYIVSINGNVVEDSKAQLVSSDDWLAVCPVVGKSGRDWFRTIGMLVLGYFTSGLATTWAGAAATNVTRFWATMAAGAVTAIGGTLINHWFPPAKADQVESKSSYNWSNAQSQTGQGNALAVTYGTMRTAGQVLAQHVSSHDEDQYLNILLCGGEGPIDSISDIRINDNPISYYKDVTVETRLGANDQTAIANFNDTYDDQSLAYELNTDSTWVTQQTDGNAVEGVEITLQFPGGLYCVNDNGSLGNASVTVTMQYRKAGDTSWNDFTTATITEKKNTAFFRTYRLDNLAAAQYEVRAQCTAKSGTSTKYSTHVYWTQLSSIMYDDFARPGKVLIGIKALATSQLSGGTPIITWLQTREKVWVWNAETSEYEQKSAANPAWAAYDMIHRCRQIKNIHTGNYEFIVQGAPASRAVYQDFARWAEFCDDYSLTFNYIFDTANDLWTLLQKPEGVGRGKVIMRGTRFGCVCDAPGDPVQLFTVGNILTDKFKETFVSLKDRANAIEVSFSNKNKAYEKEVITVYADNYDASTEPNITQITFDGVTTVEQAYREAKYRLRLNQHLVRTVEHSADIDAIACQINDVVLLAHDVPQWGISGRLLAATATTVQLDREVTLEPCKSYAVAIQITNLAATTSQDVQSIVTVAVQGVTEVTTTDTITLSSELSTVPLKWDLYSFGETNKVVKPFRVLNINRDQDLKRKITCLEYIEEVYTEAIDIPQINYSELDTLLEVSGVSVAEETYRQKDGTMVSDINIGWSIPRTTTAIRGYKVFYSTDNGTTWTLWRSGITALNTSIVGVKTETNYLVKVCTINDLGLASDGMQASLYVTGKDLPPSDVSIVSASVDATDSTKINLSWSAVDDIDLKGYKLMEGNAVVTPTPIVDTRYTYTAIINKQHNFSVVAIDNSGNPSNIPAVTSINVTIEPPTVTNFKLEQLETNRTKLNLSWDAVKCDHYVLKIGNSWSSGTIVESNLKANNYQYALTQEGVLYFMVKAVSVAGIESVGENTKSIQVTLKPNAPASGSIKQDTTDKRTLILNWEPVTDKDKKVYVIYNSQGQEIDRITDTTFRYKITASGTYAFAIKTLSVGDKYSNALNLSIPAGIEPLDVTGFAAVQNIYDHSKVTLTWNQNTEAAYFRIRKGQNWDNSVSVNSNVYGTSLDVKILDESEQIFWIKAVSASGDESQYPVKVDDIYNLNPSAPTNLVIAQDANDRSTLNISWTGIPELDVLEYILAWGDTWENATPIVTTKETKATFKPPVTGDYKIMLKARNNSDFYSDEVSKNFYATLEPSNVTGFQALQNGSKVELSYDISPDADVVSVRVIEGSSYENGREVKSGETSTSFEVEVDTERTYYFHIKALNRSGKYSQLAATAVVTVANLPPKNVILTYDEIALQNGTLTNVVFGTSLINVSNFGGRASDYPNLKASEVGGQTVLKLANANLIKDGNFASGSIGSQWIKSASGTSALVSGFLRLTSSVASSNGMYYDFPETLERNAVYVVEWEARGSKAFTLTGGFTTNAGAYASSGATGSGAAQNLTTAWQVLRREHTITSSGTEPGRYLFNYGTYAIGDWTEIKWARIYKKNDEGLFLVGQWGGGYYQNGEYVCATKDVGQVITANIATLFYATNAFALGGNAKLQYRTSRDNPNWTQWVDFKPALCTFRYVDFKVIFVTVNNQITPEVNTLKINIDVPDTMKTGTATIPVGGLTIPYGNVFWTVPYVGAHAVGAGLRAEIQSRTNSNFVVKVFNNANVDVGGSISWQAIGY